MGFVKYESFIDIEFGCFFVWFLVVSGERYFVLFVLSSLYKYVVLFKDKYICFFFLVGYIFWFNFFLFYWVGYLGFVFILEDRLS